MPDLLSGVYLWIGGTIRCTHSLHSSMFTKTVTNSEVSLLSLFLRFYWCCRCLFSLFFTPRFNLAFRTYSAEVLSPDQIFSKTSKLHRKQILSFDSFQEKRHFQFLYWFIWNTLVSEAHSVWFFVLLRSTVKVCNSYSSSQSCLEHNSRNQKKKSAFCGLVGLFW